jgi:uncharacterized protein YdcH (DUF465 family)
MPDVSELKTWLLRSDEEYRKLATQHHELDERLQSLSSKPYLSDTEKLEEVTLKKKKLHLKDRMEEILRRQRNLFASTGAPEAQPRHA